VVEQSLFPVAPTAIAERPRRRGISSHERPNEGVTNVWLTPRYLIDALGPFDLDPCASDPRPFDCATRNLTVADNGLRTPWDGFVRMNPPYGPYVGAWLDRLVAYGNGIALVFARTETRPMQRALLACDLVKFVEKRITFTDVRGVPASNNSTAPSMLLAFGPIAAERVSRSTVPGIAFRRSA
jgi:hypothetical protein